MGFHLRKSIKLGKFFKINKTKKGYSITVGGKNLKFTLNDKKKLTLNDLYTLWKNVKKGLKPKRQNKVCRYHAHRNSVHGLAATVKRTINFNINHKTDKRIQNAHPVVQSVGCFLQKAFLSKSKIWRNRHADTSPL